VKRIEEGKRMKGRLFVLTGAVMLFFMVTGCAYHLKYSVSGRSAAVSAAAPAAATFAVEQKPGGRKMNRYVESNLIDLTRNSLLARGWKEAPPAQADYTFQVSYTLVTDEQVFRHVQYLYGPGRGMYSRHRNPHFFTSTIFMNVQKHGNGTVWTGTGKITQTSDNILLVADYIVSSLVSHFPEQGRWTMHRKIHLYGARRVSAG
jgi:hypothetical protein